MSIGKFSKTCSVSIKALRYYDKVDLLKPAKIDSQTGYRYYDESQLRTMNIISRLKRYGFSLIEIKAFLSCSEKEIAVSKLKEKASSIEHYIKHSNMLLQELSILISEYERTSKFMLYENNYKVTTTISPKIYTIKSRQNMSVEDFGKYYSKLFKRAADEEITTTGQVLAIYYDKEFNEKCSDIEVAIGIKEEDKADSCIESRLCATAIHKGSYANLSEAYATIVKWIDSNGYTIDAPPYEIYLKGLGSNLPADKWETQIFFPVSKKD